MVVRARPHRLEIVRAIDPLITAARLARSGCFDSYVVYERKGWWCFAGGVLGSVELRRDTVTASWRGAPPPRKAADQPLQQVARTLGEAPWKGWRAYGWAAFELAYALHGRSDLLHGEAGDDPLVHLAIPEVEIQLHPNGAILSGVNDNALHACAEHIRESATECEQLPQPQEVETPDEHYRSIVAASIAEIKKRQLNKVILSRTIPIDFGVDLAATYVRGRRNNTPARSFLLNLGGVEAAGFSPETVVEVDRTGRVTTQPLAGTRELTGAQDENLKLRTALLCDPKEIFEHAISVKVAYDELATLCGTGQAQVDEFMSVRERGSVQHLASRVSGRLPSGRNEWDALAALFPAVTASGTPKPEALDSIHRHEAGPRGLYGGAVLAVSSYREMDAALVLRAIYRKAGRTWLRAGAGIVEHSLPDREHQETCEKLRSVAPHVVPHRTET
ncbi:MAG: salicylate synthase [Micromonosporaceae bacterium]